MCQSNSQVHYIVLPRATKRAEGGPGEAFTCTKRAKLINKKNVEHCGASVSKQYVY